MIASFKAFALRALGLDRPQPDYYRQDILTMPRGSLYRALQRAGLRPSCLATTEALRREALRDYDAGRLRPTHFPLEDA